MGGQQLRREAVAAFNELVMYGIRQRVPNPTRRHTIGMPLDRFYEKGWMVRRALSVLFRGELTSYQLSVRGQSAWQTSRPAQIASSSYRHTEAVCSASLMFVCSGLHFWVGFIGCFVLVHTWSHFRGGGGGGGGNVYVSMGNSIAVQ